MQARRRRMTFLCPNCSTIRSFLFENRPANYVTCFECGKNHHIDEWKDITGGSEEKSYVKQKLTLKLDHILYEFSKEEILKELG